MDDINTSFLIFKIVNNERIVQIIDHTLLYTGFGDN